MKNYLNMTHFLGFALETTYEDAKKIQAMNFVDSVEVSVALLKTRNNY